MASTGWVSVFGILEQDKAGGKMKLRIKRSSNSKLGLSKAVAILTEKRKTEHSERNTPPGVETVETAATAEAPTRSRSTKFTHGLFNKIGLKRQQEEVECVACNDTVPRREGFRAPCRKHAFCRDCLHHLVVMCTTDESMYPPSCCKLPVSSLQIRNVLSKDERVRFRAAKKEFTSAERLYCPTPTCSAFVRRLDKKVIADGKTTCGACQTEICTHCKTRNHEGECPEDKALSALIRMSTKKKWQRCPKCNAMVARESGCNYILCTCGESFCYACGGIYKRNGTCSCEGQVDMHQAYEFDEPAEAQLAPQAPPVAPIDAPGYGIAPQQHYQPVIAVVELPADPPQPVPPPPPPPVPDIVEEPAYEAARVENAAWSQEVNRLIHEVARRPHVEEVEADKRISTIMKPIFHMLRSSILPFIALLCLGVLFVIVALQSFSRESFQLASNV